MALKPWGAAEWLNVGGPDQGKKASSTTVVLQPRREIVLGHGLTGKTDMAATDGAVCHG